MRLLADEPFLDPDVESKVVGAHVASGFVEMEIRKEYINCNVKCLLLSATQFK